MSSARASNTAGERVRTVPWGLCGRILAALALLFLFLVGVRAMAVGFHGLGAAAARAIFDPASNPLVALAIGLLATSLVQSSSVSTSMIVAFAAVPDTGLPVESAIPMVMGANIGTTVTNSLVALGYVARKREFARALAAATCHDVFNLMTVAVLLPLELMTGFLANTSAAIADFAGAFSGGFELPNPIGAATLACVSPIERGLLAIAPSSRWVYVALLLLSALLIYGCLVGLVGTLRYRAETGMKQLAMRMLDEHPALNMVTGAITTAIVQSSSATTSALVPLSAAGLIRVRHALTLTLGANVGTTVTALLASLATPPETAQLAVQVATVHLLFNLIGVLIVFPVSKVRRLAIFVAKRFGELAAESRRRALVYILLLYYAIPAIVILLGRS